MPPAPPRLEQVELLAALPAAGYNYHGGVGGLTSFGRDARGELFLLYHGLHTRIMRLVERGGEPGNLPRDDSLVPPMPQPGGIAERARAAAGAPYLNDLNPEQREAVVTLDGPVLVLAGAGTGKTRVLTTRIAHILATGRARPGDILAVTFTNKAAREMKARVGAMVGEIVEGMPWLGTFHSIGVKIIRRHAELVGLKPDFTILDTDDQIRLLKQLLEAENIDEKRWPARVLAGLIDSWKNRGLTPDQVPGEFQPDGSVSVGADQSSTRCMVI